MKIAICISGETRGYNYVTETGRNKPEAYYLRQFMDMLLSYMPEVELDIYGHTWDHCKKPNTSLINFKKLEITNQKALIDKWTRKNFLTRVWTQESFMPELYAGEELQFIENCLEMTRRKYGQVFGAFAAYNMIEDPSQYDAVIRWRWDIGFQEEVAEGNLEKFFQLIRECVRNNMPLTLTKSSGYYIAHKPTGQWLPDDVIFIHNKSAAKIICKADIGNTIDLIYSHIGYEKHSDHILWAKVLDAIEVGTLNTHMPDIIHIKRVGPWSRGPEGPPS